MKPLKLLFDGDMIAFQACYIVEHTIEWESDQWTLHADASEAKAIIDTRIRTITGQVLKKLKYEGAYEIIVCFTDSENFRKKILPTYKANRIGKRKPLCYSGIVDWMKEVYTCYQRPTLEADDCIGILATMPNVNAVAISGDKDFMNIPGKFYDYQKEVLHEVSEADADYWHLYQTLVGDVADNYSGCPGIGKVTAEKILKDSPTWEAVEATFEKKGLSKAEALVQARVAKILRRSDYDLKNEEIILWTPKINCPI